MMIKTREFSANHDKTLREEALTTRTSHIKRYILIK